VQKHDSHPYKTKFLAGEESRSSLLVFSEFR
jgi:hypothetical protein